MLRNSGQPLNEFLDHLLRRLFLQLRHLWTTYDEWVGQLISLYRISVSFQIGFDLLKAGGSFPVLPYRS